LFRLHFVSAMLALMVLFSAGCETGDPDVTTSQSQGSALASEAPIPHQYSQMVELVMRQLELPGYDS